MTESEPTYAEAWKLLRKYANTLERWSEVPPETLLGREGQIVRLMANLLLAAMRNPDSTSHLECLHAPKEP